MPLFSYILTHVRKLAEAAGFRVVDLPSRELFCLPIALLLEGEQLFPTQDEGEEIASKIIPVVMETRTKILEPNWMHLLIRDEENPTHL